MVVLSLPLLPWSPVDGLSAGLSSGVDGLSAGLSSGVDGLSAGLSSGVDGLSLAAFLAASRLAFAKSKLA